MVHALDSSGLTLNLLKCEFAKSEVIFVGQFVGSGFRRPNTDKFKVIREMQRPVRLYHKNSYVQFWACLDIFVITLRIMLNL